MQVRLSPLGAFAVVPVPTPVDQALSSARLPRAARLDPRALLMEKSYPRGLCANREDHPSHLVETGSLAPFICKARQEDREPYRSERLRSGLDLSAWLAHEVASTGM